MYATAVKSAVTTRGDNVNAEPVKLLKRVGSTIYTVNIHFSKTSKETIKDKILRLIERDTISPLTKGGEDA
jgi:hypothetical protein